LGELRRATRVSQSFCPSSNTAPFQFTKERTP
jgi:hypothetical protein